MDAEEGVVTVDFEGRWVMYELGELDEVALAYTTTVHKSQGSEYPAVVIPLSTQHYAMLERNLFYTGVDAGQAVGGDHRPAPRFGTGGAHGAVAPAANESLGPTEAASRWHRDENRVSHRDA